MKINIIGCGKMGSSIAQRLSQEHELTLVGHSPEVARKCAEKLGAKACATIAEAVPHAELIILAVKPQNLTDVAKEMPSLGNDQLLVSILAGITTKTLKHRFPGAHILRTMPNLALLYGKGVIGMAENAALPPTILQKAETAFQTFGHLHWIPEQQMDALTALTGSGPAFLMTILESIVDAGITMGLPPEQTEALALELWQGVTTMIEDPSKTPAQWKKEIASPGGATQAGLDIMEKLDIRAGMVQTFQAAQQRAKELPQD